MTEIISFSLQQIDEGTIKAKDLLDALIEVEKDRKRILEEYEALKKAARHVVQWAKHYSMNDSLRDSCIYILEITKEE